MQHHGFSSRGRTRPSWGRPTTGAAKRPREPRQAPTALGPTVRSLAREDIDAELRHGTAEIIDCQYVASYNLTSGLTKTILVPGRPPLWTPSSEHRKLEADAGNYYRDENAARFPEYPLEPAVRAVFHMDSSFDASTIDVFACGSTLGNLLRFVQGRGEPFSFIVHTIGQTAFFVRRDSSPTELIDGVYGFGHSFVDANTTWSPDVKGSSSHQRIISYLLGGKKVMVRFEADGYTMDQTDEFDASEDDAGGVQVGATSVEDEFANMLRPQVPPAAAEAADGVTILNRGSPTAISSTVDIKTRSVRKQRDDVLAEQVPRLWLRQIDKIVLSFHKDGSFGPAAVEDIGSMLLDWEEENKAAIARLVNLIDTIKKAAGAAQDGKLEVRCDEAASLHFHQLSPTERSRWNAMPEELREEWASH